MKATARILLLLFLTGCSEQVTSYSLTPEHISQIESGDLHSLATPEPEQFLNACQRARFRANLTQLDLSHDVARYTSDAILDLANLTKVTLYVTSKTDEFLGRTSHETLKTLQLVQTDISSAGIAHNRSLRASYAPTLLALAK